MGPLAGLKIIELSGLGPCPFAGMMLADMGADVIRIEKPAGSYFSQLPDLDFLNRGKRCISINLKSAEGIDIVKQLINDADGFIEGYRPGVTERLGLGPEALMTLNPRLVYGRMTGWGQDGPMAQEVGHDINYISLTGALHAIGEKGGKPQIPLTLVGDFGGGGMMFAFGMVCALLEAKNTGKGQVVDAAMVDGAASLMAVMYSSMQTGFWNPDRGSNIFDSGAHFYNVYECADGHYISVGALEANFYQQLLLGLGLAEEALPDQSDQRSWPEMKQRFSVIFKTQTREQWMSVFAGLNACVTPVLSVEEVKDHPHLQARKTIVDIDGRWQPAPAPRFSRTPGAIRSAAAKNGEHTQELLNELGLDFAELRNKGVVL